MTEEKTTNDARQGTTTDGTARRALFISLTLAFICLGGVIVYDAT